MLASVLVRWTWLSAALGALLLGGCGRTEPFQTGSSGPGTDLPSRADGGADGDAWTPDAASPEDAGPNPDARPNFPDVGFPGLPCDGCDEIRAVLDGIRWESPCREGLGPGQCGSDGPRRQVYNLRGSPGAQYEVRLRFRGVAELRTYVGGYHEGGAWQLGGGPTANARNIFQLELSSPAQIVYLNRTDEQREHCSRLDFSLALRFNVGTSLTATLLSRGEQLMNLDAAGRPIVVNGVPPAPAPYDGQFLHMSVASIKRIR